MPKPIPEYIKNRYALDDLTSSIRLLQILDERKNITQAQGAEAMGLSIGTCNLHFQKLEYIGLIRRAETVSMGRGRSTIIWEMAKTKNFFLLLMFDTPYFQASLVDLNGKVLLEENMDLSGVSEAPMIKKLVDDFVVKASELANGKSGTIRQVFMGLPGILDPESCMVVNAVNFPVLNGIDFQAMLQERHGFPCCCGPLALAFYYGEIQQSAPDARTMVLFWDLGTGMVAGVGRRVISQIQDTLFSIGGIGHVSIERDGKLCHCGKKGCLEAYTGGWAMIDALADDNIQSLESFRHAVLDGNTEAVKVAGDAAYILGKNLAWPLQVMRSNQLIVSGPLSSIYSAIEERFIEGLGTAFNASEIAALNVVCSTDVENTMQVGAFNCARRRFFYPDE